MKIYSLLQFAILLFVLSACKDPTLANQAFAAYRYEDELSTKDSFFTRHVFIIQQSFKGHSRIYKIFIDREFAGEFWFEGAAYYPEPNIYEGLLYYKDKDTYVFGKLAGWVQVDLRQHEFVQPGHALDEKLIVGGKLRLLDKVYTLKKYPEPFIIQQ